jgi:adenine-specific DNA-methyltransferase
VEEVNDEAEEIRRLQRRIVELEQSTSFYGEQSSGLVWRTEQEEDVVVRAKYTSARLEAVSELDHLGSGADITLIEGENYDALRALEEVLIKEGAGVVDFIYIDPPYNTGRGEFSYNDHYVETRDDYRHAKWLTFMDHRIALAKKFLKPDGIFAVSIDDGEYAHLRLLLDYHFKEKAVKTVVVKMSEAAGIKMGVAKRTGTLAKLKEYVLFCGMDQVAPKLEVAAITKDRWDTSYDKFLNGMTRGLREEVARFSRDGISNAAVVELEKQLSTISIQGVRAAAKAHGVDVSDSGEMTLWKYENAWRIARVTNGSGSIRRVVESRREDGTLPEGELTAVRTSSGLLYLALVRNGDTLLLADDNLLVSPGDLWTDITTTGLWTEGGVTFKNGKKPLALIERILSTHDAQDAVVLDFFAGSGTTGEAVMRLNARDGGRRRCILVTNNENEICRDVARTRLVHAIDKGGPGSLRYLRVMLEDRREKSEVEKVPRGTVS